MNLIHILRKHPVLTASVLLAILFLPWLGMSPFNTKGEPREAIVAVSMLQSGNWILPESFGCDIPYKPPFLAWCIAILSLLTGGVTEYTSRLPSAIAAIAMGIATCRFFSKHTGSKRRGVMTALIMASSIEVWRTAMICRVDMILTACIVGAIYSFYNYRHNGYRSVPWSAILLMTMGMLTKGPVAIALPCLCLGLYGIIRGDRFWPLMGRLSLAGVLALAVPATWYAAAYHIGGNEFWQVVYDENFGRFTGTMSYESHVRPAWYNIVTILSGMLPYTLLAALALGASKWYTSGLRTRLSDGWTRLRRMHPVRLYATVCATVIFVFYCIPSSKRSVYLLPMYPMMAYGITELALWMANGRRTARMLLKTYCGVIAALATIIPPLMLYAHFSGSMPLIYGNMARLLASIPQNGVTWILMATTMVCGVTTIYQLSRRKPLFCFNAALATTLAMLCFTSGGVLPVVLGDKSDKLVAQKIEKSVPAGEPIYSFVNIDMLRYYTINFYLHDRLRVVDGNMPPSGYIVVSDGDMDMLESLLDEQKYRITGKYYSGHKSCDRGQNIMLVRYEN